MTEPIFQIRPPLQADDRFLNLLVYGKPGVGKTTFAVSAYDEPSMRGVLLLAAEPGEMSIASRQDLDVIEITAYKQLARVYDYLRIHVQLRDLGDPASLEKMLNQERKLKADHFARIGRDPMSLTVPTIYRTVILDSLSEMQKYLMYQLMSIDVGTHKLDVEPEVPEQRDWLRDAEMIRLLVRSFRNLPMHVIFVAASTEPEKKVKDEINLPGKLSTEVQGFVDMVGYFSATKVTGEAGKEGPSQKKTQRRLYLGAGYPLWDSKHRFEHISVDYIDEPTLPKILELDRKERELASTSTPRSSSPSSSTRPTLSTRPSSPSSGTRRAGPVRAAGRS